MKYEIKSDEQEFNPIEIKLMIESREELQELWHRLNLYNLKMAYSGEGVDPDNYSFNFESNAFGGLWGTLGRIMREKGIDK